MRLWVVVAVLLAGALHAETVTVAQAAQEAIEKNLGLMAERANIAIAEARAITARLRPNPAVSIGANHLDWLGTGFNDVNGGGPSEVTLHSEFTLERGGKRRARMDVAEAARSVAGIQFLDSVRNLALNVQNAFVDALLAKSTLDLARENLEAANRIVDVNTVRMKAGEIAELELIRSRLAALQSENAVRLTEMKLATSLARLQTVIGRPKPSPNFAVAGELRRDQSIPDLDEIQRLAAEQRPDLAALRRDVPRAAAEYRSQLAQAKPDLTFGTDYIRQQVNAKANSLSFDVGFALPFFNRNQGEIARALAEQRQAELRVRALQVTISGEAEVAWRQLITARDLMQSIESRMLQHARDVRDISLYSYSRREVTLLELLDAQRAFNETMQAYNEARAEYARSLYLVDAISGKAIQ